MVDADGNGWDYAELRKWASKVLPKGPYHMVLTGEAAVLVTGIVNQGIDSHLEACFVPERGDSYVVGKRKVGRHEVQTLECDVSIESLPTLLRRLFEFVGTEREEDRVQALGQDILDQLLHEEE